MSRHYKDIIHIESIHWKGEHNTLYPIVLSISINPCSEKVFAISRGWGHGEIGGGINYLLMNFGIKELYQYTQSPGISKNIRKDNSTLSEEIG